MLDLDALLLNSFSWGRNGKEQTIRDCTYLGNGCMKKQGQGQINFTMQPHNTTTTTSGGYLAAEAPVDMSGSFPDFSFSTALADFLPTSTCNQVAGYETKL